MNLSCCVHKHASLLATAWDTYRPYAPLSSTFYFFGDFARTFTLQCVISSCKSNATQIVCLFSPARLVKRQCNVIGYFSLTSLNPWWPCIPISFHAVQLPKQQFVIEESNLRFFWREELEFQSYELRSPWCTIQRCITFCTILIFYIIMNLTDVQSRAVKWNVINLVEQSPIQNLTANLPVKKFDVYLGSRKFYRLNL